MTKFFLTNEDLNMDLKDPKEEIFHKDKEDAKVNLEQELEATNEPNDKKRYYKNIIKTIDKLIDGATTIDELIKVVNQK